MKDSIVAKLREEYRKEALFEHDMPADPVVKFNHWLHEAIGAELVEPNAMVLATVSPQGRPSARVVLLKGVDENGFLFFTNYRSRKGYELTQNPFAALTFLWLPLERQVRIEGHVKRAPASISDDYFRMRPTESKLGAWASPQSDVVPDRDALESAYARIAAEYGDGEVPRPPHWGGFYLRPDTIEYWQGRPSRLHDRLCYRRLRDDSWELVRLAP